MVWKINFSQVAKISCRLVQKWPRYKKKPQKWTLKNDFSEKSPRILNFWKKFLKTHIKRANLAETDISGHEIYPKGPSRAMWKMTCIFFIERWLQIWHLADNWLTPCWQLYKCNNLTFWHSSNARGFHAVWVSPGAVTKYFLMFTAIIGQSMSTLILLKWMKLPGEGLRIQS